MGRNKEITEAILHDYYWQIVGCVKQHPDGIHLPQLEKETGIKSSRSSKALQWGRREFVSGAIPIRSYVMASPAGYFCPTTSDELVAYVAQVYKDANSRMKTTTPVYEYAAKHYPEKLYFALSVTDEEDSDYPEDAVEMQPWGVWNNLMNENY